MKKTDVINIVIVQILAILASYGLYSVLSLIYPFFMPIRATVSTFFYLFCVLHLTPYFDKQ